MPNLVHTYVMGLFHNIYGGASDTSVGTITHLTCMTPLMQEKWPWMKDLWCVSDGRYFNVYHKTLKDATVEAHRKWPGHELKTRKQIAKEAMVVGDRGHPERIYVGPSPQ